MKILYVATMLSHICQFHLPYLQMLQEQGHEVHVAAHDNLAAKNGLQLKYADRHIDIPFERSPYHPKNITAYRKLKALIEQERYDVVVCNTPVGGILARLAARERRKNGARVIYIAHGFHFYKGASKKNWLLFYPLEKKMARLCDLVVTINKEDYALAKQQFPGEVAYIHGIGVSDARFHPVTDAEQAEMRRREGLSEEDFLVFCTGELNENKDQKTLIDAAALLYERIPNLKVLLAGNGPKEQELRERISGKGLESVVKLLGYRVDLEQIVPAADLAVSCSKREGLPLNIVEAMLCKKPVVASVNRGNAELVEDEVNGYLVPPGDAEALADRIFQLSRDPALAKRMGEAGFGMAQNYTVSAVKDSLLEIISSLSGSRHTDA